jgi:tetratricopeptide (TPR) repeat protein
MYGNAAEAKRLLEAIPQQDPNYSLAQGLLSNVFLAQNDKDSAMSAAERAVAAAPDSPSAHLNLSLAHQSHFRIPEALESARRALELDPDFVAAQVQVAKLHFAMGDTSAAERIAREGLARDSSEAALNSLLGFILLAQAKTEEARSSFEKSIAQDSSRGEPHLGIGIAHMRQGRREDAIEAILVAATVEPQISIYQSYIGKAFYDERRFEMAFDSLTNASDLDPNDPTPHLYAGIFLNDLSRPGAAVRELNRSIELNDNRAVYRSRFLLDEDRATRNVNLATAYNRLYLSEWGNYEALKSQMFDPTNSSTHIFLAQTFLNLRGRTQAAGSEQLVARLLQPVNANSFNSFNDYTTLFEAPDAKWTVAGQQGSFETYSGTIIASGGARRFAYGVVGSIFTSDGYQPENGDELSFDGIAQIKFALTPHSDLLLLYSHGQQNAGDLAPPIISADGGNNIHLRQYTRRHRGEIGYHQRFRPGSDLLVLFSGQKLETTTDDPHRFPNLFGAGLQGGLRSARRDPDLNLQASHMHKAGPFQFRYGLDMFEGRTRDRRTIPCCLPEFETDFGEALESQDVRFRNIYLHTDYTLHPRLILTGALHHDWSNDNNFDNDPEEPSPTITEWNPQAGIFFSPFDSTTLRFAFIRSLQTHSLERMAPTNVDGFVIAQNDPRLSRNTGYNFGWDQRLFRSSFFRATGYVRDRRTPVLEETFEGFVPGTVENHFNGADVVWNQLIGDRFSVVPQYSVVRNEDVNGVRHEHDVTVRMFYISPRRFWVSLGENYIRQGGTSGNTTVRANFFTTDFNVSWELPRKLGLLSFGVTNLFDHRYAILVDPLALDPRVPRRQYLVSARFNF